MPLSRLAAAALLGVAVLTTPRASHAQDAAAATSVAPDKERAIRELLEATNAKQNALAALDQMVAVMRRSNSAVPAAVWDTMRVELTKDYDSLQNQLIVVYDRHLSLEDIHAIAAFYRSPAGQHFVREQPQITREAIQIGAAWGQQVAGRLRQRLRDRGYTVLQ